MDHRASQVPMPGSHRPSVPANSLPPEYWNTLDALYTGPDPQQQQQQQPIQRQQQLDNAQQPLGIDWNHPIFQQQHQPQNQLPRQQESNHGIYSSPTPQSWQQNPLQQPLMSSTPQPLGVPSNYGQVHQFPQSQLAFDSQPQIPSDGGVFDPLAFSQDFFSTQQLATPDTYSQQPQHHAAHTPPVPAVPYQARSQQAPMAEYGIPAAFSESTSHNFTNGYPESITNHQTINPQFLNTAQQAANQQHASLDNSFLFLNPSDLDPSGGSKPFNYFHNDLHMPPLNQPVMRDQSIPGRDMIVGGQAMAHARSIRHPTQVAPRTAGAPKQAKLQPKRAVPGDVEVSSDSDSDDSSDVEIQAPSPEEPSPIPQTRPTEPLAAARYDTLQAVWSPRNRRPNADKVKNALVAFKDVVKAVRDTWKDNSQAMKMAENQGNSDKATKLKDQVVLQRRLMDVVVSTTLEMGHPMIVEKLGEHPMAVTAMYSFLLDRHQAADFDGDLTVKILKLLSNFTTVDEDTLQKTNVAKVLPRFSKKGGQMVKDLTKKIQENAASSTKRKQDGTKPGSKEESPSKGSASDSATANGPRSDASAGSKRLREGESNGQPAAKRAVVTSNIKNSSRPGSTTNGASAKRPQEGAEEAKGAATAPARPKANIVAPKPTNLFGSLSSASKRPGTSNAERAAAAAARTPSGPEKKKEAPPPPKPTFSFGDIMADLNKQKEPEPAQPVEERPPETEEEREKRLRKESRRKLRVSWKPDHSLTEVRLFTHDPEEELGPGDRPQREAGDVKGEGRILKLHKDVDELGEEDEGGIREVNILEYRIPSETASDLPSEDRSRNYIKRGGTQEPTSPEKKAQEHREATTLMVFYTSLADVPPSPKEPAPPSEDEIVLDEQAFGELPDHVKARQDRYYSIVNPQPAAPAVPSTPAPGQFDISNLLKIIQSASSQQQPQTQAPSFPQPQPATPAPSSDLERTINMFRQQQQQQQQPQVPPAMPQMPQFPVPQPQAGQGVDFQKLLSVINSQKQVQQPPVLPPTPQSQPAIAPNLAAIISQLNGQSLQAGQSQASNQAYEDPERKRMRDDIGGTDSSSDERSKRTRPNLPNKKHPKVGIVPCRYWKEGKCLKGDECTFRHDPLT